MRLLLFIIIVMLGFSGCDPGYGVYLHNNSSTDVIITTNPAIESFYDKNSSYYKTIRQHKLNYDNKHHLYRILPSDTFLIFAHIGYQPDTATFPFDYISLINGDDTIILDSKEKIFQQIRKVNKKSKDGNYYIEAGCGKG